MFAAAPSDADILLERSRNLTRKLKVKKPRLADKVRHELLLALGPVVDARYDPKAFALVEEFEAALRHAWERVEQAEVRARAETKIAEALNFPAQWRLL
jgi:hypothetical protein